MLELKHIQKKYRDAEVLRDVSLRIQKGEFLTIMGSSGSGKSTLLYIMGGMEYPTSGSVHLSGRDILGLSDKQKSKLRQSEVGFVFQNYNLVQNLTVEENIVLPTLLAGKKQRDVAPRLEELLQLLGLKEQRRQIPSQLSGGQQQRVAIARAVINNPPLILADEPTGNLDSASAIQVMEMLHHINQTFETTIVHITHNSDLIGYGTRSITIKDGQIVSDALVTPDRPAAMVGNP
ncbi:ABC transporter ATP-binding protein [Paenibacillus sp. GCM10012306]|uniref:ABC transporter ATP-binding protein n=1 Tax=Paenibacillus sp. GCM10012306 TaxID=3317342 RepID=UPI00361F3E3F